MHSLDSSGYSGDAGVSDKVWAIADIVCLVEEREKAEAGRTTFRLTFTNCFDDGP